MESHDNPVLCTLSNPPPLKRGEFFLGLCPGQQYSRLRTRSKNHGPVPHTDHMTPEESLTKLEITLPEAPAGVGAYLPWNRTGNLIITSGQLPWIDGKMAFEGKLGVEFDAEQGYAAARTCAINALAQLRDAAGSLDGIAKIVRLEGYVHTAPEFRDHPRVLDGASELFNKVFGDAGRHARVALGIANMPLNAAVQLCVWAEEKPDSVSF